MKRARGPRLVAVLLLGALAVPVAARAAPGTARSAPLITMRVLATTPSTPQISLTPRPLTITVALTNTSSTTVTGVRLLAVRGDPIASQSALTGELAMRTPLVDGYPITATHAVRVTLPAHRTVTVRFPTSTGILHGSGICLCHTAAIYPIYLIARASGDPGTGQPLGTATTLLPVFDTRPTPLDVTWVWPLIDRPHRLGDETVFTDDDLAASVADGGRLSRALATIEALEARATSAVPVTLLVDPDLLDELEVMAAGSYTVQVGDRQVPGTGAAAAQQWLARFGSLLDRRSQVAVALTPYADPDTTTLSAHHLGWSGRLPSIMAVNVGTALAGRPISFATAWPADGVSRTSALNAMADRGVRTIVLDSGAVTARQLTSRGVPVGTARLAAKGHAIGAVLTTSTIQHYAAAAVTRGGAGTGGLPPLVSEIAVRVAQDPGVAHTLAITAPRYVDPDPQAAARAIRDTSTAPFATAVTPGAATAKGRLPAGHQHLTKPRSGVAALPAAVIDASIRNRGRISAISSMLLGVPAPSVAAQALVAALPVARQRTASSFWRQAPAAAKVFQAPLSRQTEAQIGAVYIIKPSSSAYTLASTNSPLPITVENDSPYPASIRLRVGTVNELPGLTTRDIGAQTVESHGKRVLQLPTTIERAGRIEVSAQLQAPDGRSLGAPITLTVRSTALGTIGIVITVAAGVVLALALLIRVIARVRVRRGAPDPVPVPVKEPVG